MTGDDATGNLRVASTRAPRAGDPDIVLTRDGGARTELQRVKLAAVVVLLVAEALVALAVLAMVLG
ncbi:hypothetical protein [Halorussus sp. AFM4]|uniref:hypothetical protein n=1 Tax=Halorussus sp. AFM4 TaxID=3421651 RepID=UPI003EC06B73